MNHMLLFAFASTVGICGLLLSAKSLFTQPSTDKTKAKKFIRIGFSGISLIFICSLIFIYLYSKTNVSPELLKELREAHDQLPDVSMLENCSVILDKISYECF